ncbi:CPBP family intramembrane metalloprotease [Spiractinospora alimapuensis]|uniref:CPBP family intramembrane glutamic endopeptidase n=1 Tax=Spiractinospora alimapuensis TaxID=2820884 RepID=UPI001F2E771C|nr:CPBP family intramembrane glutamic endopeptidase [Spiractinospora alimapuensis]QVQ52654.1 CPBP family intramembrane metalloprotease [Spiractinospora alimapuensis]
MGQDRFGAGAAGGDAHALSRPTRRVAVWVALLAALTALGVVLSHAAGVGPDEDYPPAVLLVALAPVVAAVVVAGASSRMRGLGSIVRGVGHWRIAPSWYLLVVAGPVVLVLLTSLISGALGGPVPDEWVLAPSGFLAVGLAVPWIVGMLEEIAWRGFAQPLLQVRFGALGAAVVIGAVWASWYQWPLLAPGGVDGGALALTLQLYVRLIATAVIYAWLLNTTGSLLLVMVAHLSHHVALDLLPVPDAVGAGWGAILAALYAALAAVVVGMTSPHTLTRGGSPPRRP